MNQEISRYSHSKAAREFRFATMFIKIIAMCVGLFVLIISRYAFVLFAAAMLPSVVAIFVDRTDHKCASATICSFNLLGTIPYLIKLCASDELTHVVQLTISDIRTWVVIYGSAIIGQAMYWALPLLFAKLYIAKSKVQAAILGSERDRICADWGIRSDDPYRDFVGDDDVDG